MPKIIFLTPRGERHEIEAPIGLSVMEVAKHNGIDIEAACEGSLACATCHVVVDPSWYDKLPRRAEEEEDMLDLAFGLTKTSRLSCQILVSEELDGLIVTVAGS